MITIGGKEGRHSYGGVKRVVVSKFGEGKEG